MFYNKNIEQIEKELNTNSNGLTKIEVQERIN